MYYFRRDVYYLGVMRIILGVMCIIIGVICIILGVMRIILGVLCIILDFYFRMDQNVSIIKMSPFLTKTEQI